MAFDQKEFFRVFGLKHSFAYPGNSIAIELTVMRAWLENLSIGIEAACSNYIELELSKFPKDADYSEYRHVYDIAEEDMPRIVNMSAIISVVALYETATARLLSFCARQENVEFKLSRESLAIKFDEFASKKLGIDLSYEKKFLEKARDITIIRNNFAHGSAMISAFSHLEKTSFENENEDLLADVISRSSGQLSLQYGQLTLTHSYLINCFELFEFQTKRLMTLIEARYFQ